MIFVGSPDQVQRVSDAARAKFPLSEEALLSPGARLAIKSSVRQKAGILFRFFGPEIGRIALNDDVRCDGGN